MRYATQVCAGAERRVTQLLHRHGIRDVDCRMAGYVCWEGTEETMAMVKTVRGVQAVLPMPWPEETGAPCEATPTPIRVGQLVTISCGPYMQLSGRIARLHQGKALVYLTLLGRLVPAEVLVEALKPFELPEAWR